MAAGDVLFAYVGVITSSIHLTGYPVHSFRYIVRARTLLEYCYTPSQKIMGRRENKCWLGRELFYHIHVRKKNRIVSKMF